MNHNKLEIFIKYMEDFAPTHVAFYRTCADFFDQYGDNITEENICEYITKKKYTTFKGVRRLLTLISAYGKSVGDKEAVALAKNLDAKELWNKTTLPSNRFVSYAQFQDIYNTLDSDYAINGLYYRTLFLAVYEGVYSGTFDVLANLRASDIHGNVLTLRTDNGHVYDFEVSQLLADNLRELSCVKEWAIQKGDVWCYLDMTSAYDDNCFKVCVRESLDKDISVSVRRKLRSLFCKTIIDFVHDKTCHPYQFYVSGLLHRITPTLKAEGLTIKDALQAPYSQVAVKILRDEMTRCNDLSDVMTLRLSVSGYLNILIE